MVNFSIKPCVERIPCPQGNGWAKVGQGRQFRLRPVEPKASLFAHKGAQRSKTHRHHNLRSHLLAHTMNHGLAAKHTWQNQEGTQKERAIVFSIMSIYLPMVLALLATGNQKCFHQTPALMAGAHEPPFNIQQHSICHPFFIIMHFWISTMPTIEKNGRTKNDDFCVVFELKFSCSNLQHQQKFLVLQRSKSGSL